MIICIVGPTGVGKTNLSIALAKRYDAIVVNSDASQIYREMDIGTAKVTKKEMDGVTHLLFDIKNPNENYTVFDYQRDLREVLKRYKDRNVIIVGGTGLYLKAGLFDYEFTPRENKSYDDLSNEELYQLLKNANKLDGVHINNRQRMISKLNSTGNHGRKDVLLYKDILFIGLTTDRKNLYERIDARTDEMVKNGLIEEVENLYKKYGKARALSSAIGYKEIISYFEKGCSLDEAIDKIKKRSRHYAKRQYTWFNNQMNITWFETDYDNFSNTVCEVEKYIEREKEKKCNTTKF